MASDSEQAKVKSARTFRADPRLKTSTNWWAEISGNFLKIR